MTRRPPSPNTQKRGKASGQKAVVHLPFSVKKMRMGAMICLAFLVLIAASAVFRLANGPQRLSQHIALGLGDAGFSLRHVQVDGLHYLSRLQVQAAIAPGAVGILPDIDPAQVRARLLAMPWVEQATVERHFPNRLEIIIKERKPFALWQHDKTLTLIDAKGVAITREGLGAFAKLPIVVGSDANLHAQSLLAAFDDLPTLRDRVDAAIRVGKRRWDVRFKTGETLTLPAGDEQARRAIIKFDELNHQHNLLERGFLRFDMRQDEKMIIRLPFSPKDGKAAERVREIRSSGERL